MSSLLSLVKTTHSREVFINYLDRCVIDKEMSLLSINDSFDHIMRGIGINSIKDISEQKLQSIKSELLQASTVKLSVNTILSTSFVDKLYKILFINGDGLIDIEINSSSSGGFILYKEGKVFNYSFEHIIHNIFVNELFKQKLAQYL